MNTSKIDIILNEAKRKQTKPNFVLLSFIISLLIIDFFPYFKSHEIINPQFLYLSLINLIAGVYFYFNGYLIAAIFPIFKRSSIFRIYLAFLFLCAISFFNAKNVSLVLTKITELGIIFCLFVNLCILLKDKRGEIYNISFIICICAFLQSWQKLCHFVIIPKDTSINELLGTLKGNTGNINIMAASLTIKIPFILIGITHFTYYKKWIAVISLFSVTAVIFLTGARTPLINLFLIFLLYIGYYLNTYSLKKSIFVNILYLILPVLLSILLANSVFKKSKNNSSRYVSLQNRVVQINAEDASSKARLAYWSNALKISKSNPVFGIGLGNYQIESIPYEKTINDNLIVSLHTHNDFLEILSETGIVNCLIYLSLFIFVFIINLKILLKCKDNDKKQIAVVALMLLIVYVVDSLFNFPMYRPTVQIFFALLLAITVINNSKVDIPYRPKNTIIIKIICLLLIVTALVTSYSAFIIYKASNLEYLIVRDNINNNEKGELTGDEVENRIPKYPNVLCSSESFYEYAAIYYIREKNYEKAFKCFSKAEKINPYLGRINFYKQVIAKQRGNLDSAYIYSKKAFYQRPRNYSIYKTATSYAIAKKDTVELLKEHELFSQFKDMPETWITVSVALQNSGANIKRVISFIDQGLKKIPKDTTLLKQRNTLLITHYLVEGQNYESQAKPHMALKSYRQALKIDPKNVYVLQNIGFYYFNTGQNKKGIYYLKDALKYPGLYDGKTEFFLGICYLNEKDKGNACKYLSIAKTKNFTRADMMIAQSCR